MNFFGHAVVASWHQPHPGFVLGSMLPDFAGMAGCKLGLVKDSQVAAGVELHHLTDSAFHRCEPFTTFCHQELNNLTHAGIGRGTARAVAHVGFEMMLDGWLIRQKPKVHVLYLNAVECFDHLLNSGEVELEHFRTSSSAGPALTSAMDLSKRLSKWGVPSGYDDVEQVLFRLTRVLQPRPRLAIPESQQSTIREWIQRVQPEVVARGPSIMQILRKIER